MADRISQLLNSQGSLFSLALEPDLEAKVQRYAVQILVSRSAVTADVEFTLLSVDSLELVRPRRVGIEHLALHALSQL